MMRFWTAGLSVFLCWAVHAQTIPEFVTIGNPNNLPDTNGYPTEFGSVPYIYKISKYETKVSEYVAFLNSAAVSSDPYTLFGGEVIAFINRSGGPPFTYTAKSGASNKPIGGITWLAAARYANWLHNGATNGSSTENGAYDLHGVTSGVFHKNAGARYWIPSEAEWYKAAYYDPSLNGDRGGYWPYATRSTIISTNDANFGVFLIDLSTIREVGSYSNRSSFYGTFDQTGNLDELVCEDSLVYQNFPQEAYRGGSLNYGTYSNFYAISSSQPGIYGFTNSYILFGFRLAAALTTNVSSVTNSLEFVRVDQTNAAAHSSGYGFVGYPYEISKYEITIEQYTAFLNAVAKSDPYGLFDTNMESDTWVRGIQRQGTSGNYRYVLRGTANRPITYINWFRAARFANWLHNGANTNPASTEAGAYNLNGNTSSVVAPDPNALYRIPTENEWFKAAFYDPTNNRYWTYPTRSDAPPANNLWGNVPIATYSNNGSYTLGNNPNASANKLTGVGQTRSPSAYGTYDQGGNAGEWVDGLTTWNRGVVRGGTWIDPVSAMNISSTNNRLYPWPYQAWSVYGFRLVRPASTNNPTPTNPPVSGGPVITSFSPPEVVPGDEIDIFGSGFGTSSNTVLINLIFQGGDGPDGNPSLWTDTRVRVRVPESATTGTFSLFYSTNPGATNILVSPGILKILSFSNYSAWKRNSGFTNDNDRPGGDGLSMMDRYFHGVITDPTNPTTRPLAFAASNSMITLGQSRPILKFPRARRASEIDFWVERNTNLSGGSWQRIQADVLVESDPTNSTLEQVTVTDLSAGNQARGFYRLGLSTNLSAASASNLPSVQERNLAISFPKIFQPWPDVARVLQEGRSNSFRSVDTNDEAQLYYTPRHHLRWDAIWRQTNRGESFLSGPSDPTKTELAQKLKNDRKLNPLAIRLAVVEYFEGQTNNDAALGLPSSSGYWLKIQNGSKLRNFDTDGGGTNFTCLLDFSNPDLQELVATRAASLVTDGLYDGIFLDCWSENRTGESQWSWIANNGLNSGGSPRPWGLTNVMPTGSTLSEVERKARLDLLQKIRNKIGTNKIIIANINYGLGGGYPLNSANPLLSGTNLDGVYMECWTDAGSLTRSPYLENSSSLWRKIEETWAWVETPGNLRSQGFNCLEIWHQFSKFDPRDLQIMRAGLALSLVCSDSYYLFSEPNWWNQDPPSQIGVKRHAWYDDWNRSLGRPVSSKRSPIDNGQKNPDGTYSRTFDQGVVFYNPPDNPQKTLLFAKPVKSVSTGIISTNHTIGQGPEGDIFLLTRPGDPR